MQDEKEQRNRHGLSCLSEMPSLSEPPLLSAETAAELAAVFETLANDTRLRMLHVMVQGAESSTTQLAVKVGMKPQAISNQLKCLSDRQIVARRREGNQVYYSIVDPCVIDLLKRGLWLLQDAELRAQARRGSHTAKRKSLERQSLDGDNLRSAGAKTLESQAVLRRKPGSDVTRKGS
jgi:DNA-binding transcriptional ArsR family regulator